MTPVRRPLAAINLLAGAAVELLTGAMRLRRDSLRDGRDAFRLFRAAPGFAGAAVATLALGIGATSAIFSVVRTVLIEPLSYRDADRIVTVWRPFLVAPFAT